ncbi:MAG: putative metal-binding motif-containing protein [Pseudomonadota bacterium]
MMTRISTLTQQRATYQQTLLKRAASWRRGLVRATAFAAALWAFVALVTAPSGAVDLPVSCGTLQAQGQRNPCDDGLFCNGLERCLPGDPNATTIRRPQYVVSGCVRATNPCGSAAGQCNENTDRCGVECADADGDGSQDAACGGDDCDDNNPNRYPGNVEVCDVYGIDEDCDPRTWGEVDRDDDGWFAASCTMPPRLEDIR